MKSVHRVDRDIFDRALGRLGLPARFRQVYFAFHQDAFSSSWLLASVKPGPDLKAIHQGVLLLQSSLWHSTSHSAEILESLKGITLRASVSLIIRSALPMIRNAFFRLPSLRSLMSRLLVWKPTQECAF